MDAVRNFRQFLFYFRKRVFRRKKKLPLNPGLPAGIDFYTINHVCQDCFGQEIATASYQHLSGWKYDGAYRVFLTTSRNRKLQMIYKNAIYENNHIPALSGLPVQPGPPEYAVYSQPNGVLKPYLPEIYLAESIKPGIHYRYLLEDLSQHYHKVQDGKEFLEASKLLPQLHGALETWAKSANTQGFLQYGEEFSRSLERYSQKNLEKYLDYSNDPMVEEVLKNWEAIKKVYLRPQFFNSIPKQFIHGDSNYTNLYINNKDKTKFKVVDWEWAGIGPIYSDLVSLLKGAPNMIEEKSIAAFSSEYQGIPSTPTKDEEAGSQQKRDYFLWCKLERGLLDAAFLSAQQLNTTHLSKFNLSKAINKSMQVVMSSFQELSS